MSQSQKGNVPARRVSTTKQADRPANNAGGSNRSSNMSTRSAGSGGGRNGGRPSGGSGGARRPANRYVEHRRDPFPYVMGGVIGALVVGLMMVMFLIGSSTSGGNQGNNQGGAGATTLPNAANNPPANNPQAQATSVNPVVGPTQIEAIRMPIEEFMTLYSDPAKRPIVLDVRSQQAYDEGHIAGAVSIPDPSTESRLAELPKDRLIVAYCQ